MTTPDASSTRYSPAAPSRGLWSAPVGQFFRYWLPVFAYVALIFWVSSFSTIQLPGANEGVDKAAHAIEYGILCFLLVRALRDTGWISSTGVAGATALLLGLLVGLADELFQSTVPGRESDPADFAADAVGLVLAVLLFAAIRPGRKRRR